MRFRVLLYKLKEGAKGQGALMACCPDLLEGQADGFMRHLTVYGESKGEVLNEMRKRINERFARASYVPCEARELDV